jgi:hypothetical protein
LINSFYGGTPVLYYHVGPFYKLRRHRLSILYNDPDQDQPPHLIRVLDQNWKALQEFCDNNFEKKKWGIQDYKFPTYNQFYHKNYVEFRTKEQVMFVKLSFILPNHGWIPV